MFSVCSIMFFLLVLCDNKQLYKEPQQLSARSLALLTLLSSPMAGLRQE